MEKYSIAKIKLDVGAGGTGTLTVNDINFGDFVDCVRIEIAPHKPTYVWFRICGDVEAQLEAPKVLIEKKPADTKHSNVSGYAWETREPA